MALERMPRTTSSSAAARLAVDAAWDGLGEYPLFDRRSGERQAQVFGARHPRDVGAESRVLAEQGEEVVSGLRAEAAQPADPGQGDPLQGGEFAAGVDPLAVSDPARSQGRSQRNRIRAVGGGADHRQGAEGRTIAGLIDAEVVHAGIGAGRRDGATGRSI
jgi:hypothetical protein